MDARESLVCSSAQAARMWKPLRQWFDSHEESAVETRYSQAFVEASKCNDATSKSFGASKVLVWRRKTDMADLEPLVDEQEQSGQSWCGSWIAVSVMGGPFLPRRST